MSKKTILQAASAAVIVPFFGFIFIVTAARAATIQFTDVSATSGVGSDLYRAINFHSLGVNWIDYDNDGWPDLFLVNGYARSPHLFHNNGNGTFTKVDNLLPVLPTVEMGRSAFADYDNDGDSDIYIFTDTNTFELFGANEPDGPANLLLKNKWIENGNQTIPGVPLFEQVAAAAGVADLASPSLGNEPGFRAMTGGWLDYNRDGCVDLYVGHWVLQSAGAVGNRDRFYQNNCNGTFQNVTAASGLNAGTDPLTYRPALGFIAAHLDGDLWPEVYVVNVHEPSPYHHDFLFKNNGNGTFSNITGSSPGIGDDSGSGMGIDVADIDLDGDWDIYITDILETTNDALPLGNVLYLNNFAQNSTLTFSDNSAPAAGVAADFSWGANFFDVDQNGYEDLYVATNSGKNKFLFINNGNGTFTNVGTAAGINDPTRNSRGSATADYDGDGDIDLAVINQDGGLQLYRNDSLNIGNWFQISLAATVSNRDAIGSLVKLKAGSLNLMRQVKGGSSGHSQDALALHFGLGSQALIDKVEVFWPSGVVDTLCNQAVNQKMELQEGSAPNPTCASDTSPPTWPGPNPLSTLAVSPSQINLSWTAANDDVGVTAYRVFRGGNQIAVASSTSYSHTGLTPNTNYCYTVVATDAGGNTSVSSNQSCAMTLVDTTPPSAPADLTAVLQGSYNIRLTWGVSSDNVAVQSYNIYRDGLVVANSTLPLYIDMNLTLGTTYCYRVTAIDTSGNPSGQSNEACEMPRDISRPSEPTGLQAISVTETSVELAWTAAVDDVGVVKYRIYRGATLMAEPTVTTWKDLTVAPATTYTYSVTALDAAGNESFADAVLQVTTPGPVDTGPEDPPPAEDPPPVEDPEPMGDPVDSDPTSGDASTAEADDGEEESDKSGDPRCFIATAAFGSPMEPRVMLLREVRDRYLKAFGWGQEFIEFYYTHSPALADKISESPGLRMTVRGVLWPVLAGGWLFLEATLSQKMAFFLCLLAIMIAIRIRRCQQRSPSLTLAQRSRSSPER